MALTGADLAKLFKQDADTAYSGYWSDARIQRSFDRAFTAEVQEVYSARLVTQNAFDELSYLLAAGVVFNVNPVTNTIYTGYTSFPIAVIFNVGTAVTITTSIPHDLITGTRIQFANIAGTGNITTFNGQIYSVTVVDSVTFTFTATFTNTGVYTPLSGIITFPDNITDYYHFLRAEVRFTQLTDFTVVKSTNTTPIKITLGQRSYLMTEDEIVIAGIGGNTNANGTFYLEQANEFDYFLFTDKYLRVPAVGNGVQTGTGTVSEIFRSTIRFKRSDEKGSIYAKPTVESPFYQQTKNYMKILPADQPCDWMRADYIRQPPVTIDITNSTTDLIQYYPDYFLYKVVSKAVLDFDASTRDTVGVALETNEGGKLL